MQWDDPDDYPGNLPVVHPVGEYTLTWLEISTPDPDRVARWTDGHDDLPVWLGHGPEGIKHGRDRHAGRRSENRRPAVNRVPASMKERMLAGAPYMTDDPELVADKARCPRLVCEYNAASDSERERELLEQLLGFIGAGTVLKPPVHFNYGYQTTIGAHSFVNTGAVILDVGRVSIGDSARIGPNVQLLTPLHPMNAVERTRGMGVAAVGDDLRRGLARRRRDRVRRGCTIGEDAVIGAGSVVTHDVPPRTLAAGNPCRVIRDLPQWTTV